MNRLNVDELRKLSDADLVKKLRELKEELFNIRFQNATGQLENASRIQAVKRSIARVKTIQRQRELEAQRA